LVRPSIERFHQRPEFFSAGFRVVVRIAQSSSTA
jgi:hypothetical protein